MAHFVDMIEPMQQGNVEKAKSIFIRKDIGISLLNKIKESGLFVDDWFNVTMFFLLPGGVLTLLCGGGVCSLAW